MDTIIVPVDEWVASRTRRGLPPATKRCRACDKRLPVEAFGRDSGNKDGLAHRCRTCANAYNRERHRRLRDEGVRPRPVTDRQRWHVAAQHARDIGRVMALSYEQWCELAAGPCAYCGDALPYAALDRVDSARGYEVDNVVPCCWTCNSMKKVMSREAFVAHLRKILAHLDTLAKA